jgi:glycosyltransferase involved in cell wall biosynthesis
VREVLASGIDAVLAWHCRGIVKTSLRMIHEAGVPILYQLHDRWLLYERPGSLYVPWGRLDRLGARLPRELLGRLAASRIELRAPRIDREGTACFVSEWLEHEHTRRGLVAGRREVVHCGVRPDDFRHQSGRSGAPHKLLYAGRIERRKGLDVAVRCLPQIERASTLTVVGPVDDPAYADQVRASAETLGVADRISWLGEVARSSIPPLLGEHDVLVFPSIGVEAYALGLLEAFAAGALVVTSAPGGPREYLRHEINALLHEPGDADGLAAALRRLSADPALCAQLLKGARRTVEALSLDAIVDQVEVLLTSSASTA